MPNNSNTHMLHSDDSELRQAVQAQVQSALQEDIGSGDITAQLIDTDTQAIAHVICREDMVVCGRLWVDEVFHQLDPAVQIQWSVDEGATIKADSTLFTLKGRARSLLTGERTALNFLQSLSGTATLCHHYASQITGTHAKLLDTRKTIPGLRLAQKYAVRTGGCHNHRIGLYDAFLIKENHIIASGGIAKAIARARDIAPGKSVEVEVESISELEQAIKAGADTIMLDNFGLDGLREAVQLNADKALLEASGGITFDTLKPIAETGVDYISIGALTKDCRAIDLSMRMTANFA